MSTERRSAAIAALAELFADWLDRPPCATPGGEQPGVGVEPLPDEELTRAEMGDGTEFRRGAMN
jgi:hypothetical protein